VENKTISQRKELIKELRKLATELSDTVAKISKIADEFGDDYVRRTLIADLEWLLDDADYHSYNDTLWSWVKSLEEEYKEDETEDDVEMENKRIKRLTVYDALIEPMKLDNGKYRWVVTNFGFPPADIYDDKGNIVDANLFKFEGDSKDELLDTFNDQQEN